MAYSRSDIFNVKVLSTIGLLAFAFFGWLGTAGSSFGAGLLLIALLFQIRPFLEVMKREPLFWLSFVAILFIIMHWLKITQIDEQTIVYAKKYTMGIIYLWLFSVVAWNLYHRDELKRWMIGLAAAGLIIKILMEIDWQNLAVFFNQRQDFGFSFTGAGLHSALSVWGLLVISIFSYRKYRGFIRWTVIPAALMGVIVLAEALVLTQARSGWAAMLAGLFFTSLLLFAKEGKAVRAMSYRQWGVIGLIVTVLLSGFFVTNFTKLSARISAESNVYGTILSLDRKQIPYSSVGARAHMLLYGVELWQEKPLFGWGVGSSRSLLAKDEILKRGDHPHFHNNYLELLVEQGVVGFMFYLVAFILLMHGLFKAYAEGAVAKDLFYYLIGAWVMVLVWSLADSRMVHADVRFVLLLLSGITFSFILKRDREPVSD